MLPLVEFPAAIVPGLAPCRPRFGREADFGHIERDVRGLIVNPNQHLQGLDDHQVGERPLAP